MLGDGNLQLTEVAPGAQTWLAQLNANLLEIERSQPWILTGAAGEALASNQAVCLETSGQIHLADSNAAAPRFNMLGIALNSAAIGVQVRVRMMGMVTFTHSFTPGALLYLSGTPGALTVTPPTTPRIVGMAFPSNKILIYPMRSWAAA